MGTLSVAARRLEPLGEDRIVVRRGASLDVVCTCDLLFIRAMRNSCYIATVYGDVRVHATLQEVVGVFGEPRILKIHRGAAVNLARIRRVVGRGGHRLSVVLDTGQELPVGREFQSLVRGFFISSEPNGDGARRRLSAGLEVHEPHMGHVGAESEIRASPVGRGLGPPRENDRDVESSNSGRVS